jgi:hypothetical protein
MSLLRPPQRQPHERSAFAVIRAVAADVEVDRAGKVEGGKLDAGGRLNIASDYRLRPNQAFERLVDVPEHQAARALDGHGGSCQVDDLG